ncbi:hypothetical protein G3M48_006074 [Beauveria asiatica]|uniref:Major facilitator superfamily (MFS) profile domain-containing protein n=1 Tax=Beauveria asiatica TaxID=1069075 RepID=A0AAW0RQG8_9HYPO
MSSSQDILATRPAFSCAEVLANDKSPLLSLPPSSMRFYAFLAPACLVVCATNGYDGSVMPSLQGVSAWPDQFGSPTGALLAITSACYPLGAILSTPNSSRLSDTYGHRSSIIVVGFIMIAGVAMQFTTKAASLFNQFVNPISMDSLGWKYYLVYVGWLLVEMYVFSFST